MLRHPPNSRRRGRLTTLNYLLGRLEGLGYLERQQDAEDRRSKRIVLSPRGISLIPVIRDAVSELENAWTQELGPEHFSQLRALLLELNELA